MGHHLSQVTGPLAKDRIYDVTGLGNIYTGRAVYPYTDNFSEVFVLGKLPGLLGK